MFQTYKDFNFRESTIEIIDCANRIIVEYQVDGYDLTLRQLYYQFVSRGIIANSQKEYSRLGDIISNARLAGHIDWEAIKDRTRAVVENSHWEGPAEILESAAYSFKLDTRRDQKNYIEVWIEKEALAGIAERVCGKLDIPFFACRGYVSQSAMYEAACRIKQRMSDRTLIIHLGDHDPSGINMTRDIRDRLEMFECDDIEIDRIALNMNQVEQYSPPPNPAKMTDSRCNSYVDQYGYSSWELDALDPKVITNLIKLRVAKATEHKKLRALQEKQEDLRKQLLELTDNFE